MNLRRWTFGDDGSTLPELMVAGAITLVALTMVGGTVIAPLGALGHVAEPDSVEVELQAAADAVARIVRAARPGPSGAAVAQDDGAIVVRLAGRTGDIVVRVAIVDGELLAAVEGSGGSDDEMRLVLPRGPLASGLDADRSALEVIAVPHAIPDAQRWTGADAQAVVVRLHAAGRETMRIEHVRGDRWR